MNRAFFASPANVAVVAIVLAVVDVGAGCFDTSIPPGALISCSDGVCPDGFTCEPTTGLCVTDIAPDLVGSGVVVVDGDDIFVDAEGVSVIGGPAADRGAAVTATLTFETAPLRITAVRVEHEGGVVDVDVDFALDGAVVTAHFAATRALPEGRSVVVVDAVNQNGLPRTFAVGRFDVDLTPPTLGPIGLSRTPDLSLTPVAFEIAEGTSVSAATALRVSVPVDEAVVTDGDDAPSVRVVDLDDVTFVRDAAVPNPVTFDLDRESLVDVDVDDVFDLEVRVVDRAGNVRDEVVTGVLHIDTIAPDAPNVDGDGVVVFERAPWGRSERGGADVYTVRGDVGAVEANAFVLVSKQPNGTRELGRTRADDAGSFGGLDALALDTGDLDVVYVRAADDAGNVSAVVPVRDTLWIASTGGKVVGDLVANPHTFEDVPFFDLARIHQGGVSERGAEDGLDVVDANVDSVHGAATFAAVATDVGDAIGSVDGVLVDTAVGSDPARGITLFFGGSDTGRTEMGSGSLTDRDFCTGSVDDVFVSGADGRLRRIAPTVRPAAMHGAAIAYDPRVDGLVLLGTTTTGVEQWLFRNGVFTQLCTDDGCRATLPPGAVNHSLAYDRAGRRLLAHGGGLDGTWAFVIDDDGDGVWQQVCGGTAACTAPPSGDGSLMVDASGRVLFVVGARVFAFVDDAWSELCTDDACVASRPPETTGRAAFDKRRGVVVLFGTVLVPGEFGAIACNFGQQIGQRFGAPPASAQEAHTYEFDGTLWQEATPVTSPPPRARFRMSYDDRAGAVVVIGGDDCDCYDRPGSPLRAGFDEDVWRYDGVTWTRGNVLPTPPAGFVNENAFAARDHKMTTWANQGGVMLVGQNDGLHLIKNGFFFASVAGDDAAGFGDVVGDIGPGVAADDNGDIMVVGGGAGDIGPAVSPPGFAFHVVDNRVEFVCADGDPSCGGGLLGQPPFTHAWVFDGVRFVGFGGGRRGDNGFGFRLSELATGDVFAWATPSQGFFDPCSGGCSERPPARTRAAMARTNVDGTSLLYGGAPFDTRAWVFDGAAFHVANTTTTPRARQEQVMTYDPRRGAVFMTGGTDADNTNDTRGGNTAHVLPADLDDVYEFVDDDWHLVDIVDVENDGRPAPRSSAASAADIDGTILIHGGTLSPAQVLGTPNASTPRVGDLWRYDSGATHSAAQRFRVRIPASHFNVDELGDVEVRFISDAERVLLWTGERYEEQSPVACGAGCVGAVVPAATVHAAVFGPQEELVFVVVSAENGVAPARSAIATDFVDVRVHARR